MVNVYGADIMARHCASSLFYECRLSANSANHLTNSTNLACESASDCC